MIVIKDSRKEKHLNCWIFVEWNGEIEMLYLTVKSGIGNFQKTLYILWCIEFAFTICIYHERFSIFLIIIIVYELSPVWRLKCDANFVLHKVNFTWINQKYTQSL